MSIGISIIAAILGYIILMLVSVNVVGGIVRGLVSGNPDNAVVTENISESKSIVTTVIFSLICIVFLYALFHFWNIGVVLAAVMLMISRIPDLLFEIRTGQKITQSNMPKRPIDVMFNIIGWLALLVLWYSLYYLQSRVTF